MRPVYALSKTGNIPGRKRKILEAGLFFIMHEGLLANKSNPLEALITEALNRSSNSPWFKRGEKSYKENARDYEYIFDYTNTPDDKPFIPFFKTGDMAGKKLVDRFLPIATNGQNFMILLEPEGKNIKVIHADTKHEDTIPYETDPQNIVQLPKGWTWLSTQERKDSRYKPIYDLRQQYAIKYTKEGYNKFWNEFKELAEPVLEK